MNITTEVSQLLDKICEENDYVLAFQTTQEVRDLAAEIKRLAALTNIAEKEWQSTDLEPLLGVLTAFISGLDISISLEKTRVYENKNKIPSEYEDDGSGSETKYDDVYVSYLEDIKSGAVRSRDRVVEYQLMMIKKIIFT